MAAGFEAIKPQLENIEAGQPVEISEVGGETGGLLMALAMEEAPVGTVADLFARAKVLMIERRIQDVRNSLAQLPPEEQTSSPLMAELLALQDDRRKWEHRD